MKKREIFIELTSLLDVILIMLFVLLSQAKLSTDEMLASSEQDRLSLEAVQQELAGEKAANELLHEKLGEYERRELTLDVVEENSLIVTLSLHGTEARYILVEHGDSEALRVACDAEDENYSANKLRTTVSDIIADSGKETVFVVFQYERSSIYQREYRLVSSVVQELKAEAKNADIALNYIETDILKEKGG